MNWSSKWDDTEYSGSWHSDKPLPKEFDVIKIRQFTIKEGHKSYTFVGEIVGDLALDYSDDGWNIYHVPTLQLCSKLVPGYVKNLNDKTIVMSGIICYEYEREQLLRWMAKVQTNYQTAWTMLRLLTPENYESKGQSAKDIILEWCLSVKVE